MTIFDYLNIKNDYNLLTEQFFAYDDKLCWFKPKKLFTNISNKITTRRLSLSEQIGIPITLIDTPIPTYEEVDHMNIYDTNNKLIYTEKIFEKPNVYIPTHIPTHSSDSFLKRIRGISLLISNINVNNMYLDCKSFLLYKENFNTIYPDGSPFDIKEIKESWEPYYEYIKK